MRCILHIGTEKTGTTSLQRYFAKNRNALLAQGVFYPRTLGTETHRKAAVYGMSVARADDAFQAFGIKTEAQHAEFQRSLAKDFGEELRVNRGAAVCIISSEHLHSRLRQLEEIQSIAELLRPLFDDIKVYVHLRPQLDVAVSLASTQTRVGGTVRKAFFDVVRPQNIYYNFLDLIRMWSAAFGKTNVLCIPFKRDPDLAKRLAEDLSLDTSAFSAQERVNEALDVRVMALVNVLIDGGLKERLPLTVLDQLPVEERLKLSESMGRAIQDRFKTANAQLASERDEIAEDDLEPDWSRYPQIGNFDVLEQRSPLAGVIAAVIKQCMSNQPKTR